MIATLTILLLAGTMAPTDPGLPAASFTTGEEMVYTGEVNEESLRIDLPYKRKQAIEVRVFVLSRTTTHADLAVMTSLQVKEDPHIANAATSVTGLELRGSRTPAVRLELVRIGATGTIQTVHPKAVPPLVMNEKTEAKDVPAIPLDAMPTSEFGFYLVRPATTTTSSFTWKIAEKTRPDQSWSIREIAMRRGTQVVELSAEQQSEKWSNPTGTDDTWRRTDAYSVATSDGLTRQFTRTLERKEGLRVVERRIVVCELTTPPTPIRGDGYTAIRKEIEAAYAFTSEWESGRAVRLVERIDAFAQRHRETSYRAAIEAVRRRATK
jgi:hypothetical protein